MTTETIFREAALERLSTPEHLDQGLVVVGTGSVDPVAALTWQLPTGNQPGAASVKPVAVPPAPGPKDTKPRTVAVAGTAALAVLVAVAGAVTTIAARRRKDPTA